MVQDLSLVPGTSYRIGDYVTIDDDKSLVTRGVSYQVLGQGSDWLINVLVEWFNNGDLKSFWIYSWRLTQLPAEEKTG